MNECSKLAQRKYKTRHDWVGKVIQWDLCLILKFDHTNTWYMHNPESVLENETHKLLWNFKIETDHLISNRRPGLVIINRKKRTCQIVNLAILADNGVKIKESKKRDKYRDISRELKKTTIEHEGDRDISCNWCARNNLPRFGKGTGRLRIQRTSENHLDNIIIKIGQNTEKSPEDLRRLAVSQTRVKNH